MGIGEIERLQSWSVHRGHAEQARSAELRTPAPAEDNNLPTGGGAPPEPSGDNHALAKPAVFLDRDGVINPTVLNPSTGRMESPLSADDFCLFDGVLEALYRLREENYPLVLVSNQPNFALGKSTLDGLTAIHYKFVHELVRSGIAFARFCYCLHHPRGVRPGYSGLCVCRKPSPWFLLRARDDFGFTLANSWMIGDQPTDMQCGKAAGAKTIRIAADAPASDSLKAARPLTAGADHFVRNLSEAVDIILAHRGV